MKTHAMKRQQASEGTRIDSRSAVERAIDRAKSDKTGTWDGTAQPGMKKIATWVNPHQQDMEEQ